MVSAANWEDLSGFVEVLGNVVGAHALAVPQHLHAVRQHLHAVRERARAVWERACAVQRHARVVGQPDAAGSRRGDEVGELATVDGGPGAVASASTSCEAAVRVKPRARLCEPWVSPAKVFEPRRGDTDY